jgi:hypothetical protein
LTFYLSFFMILEEENTRTVRERFIADTLYKKLWIHDFTPCP